MNIKELDKWYSIKEYDPEGKELNRILKSGNVKNKDILVIGIYGVMHVSFQLLKYAKSVTAVHNNKKVIDHCKKKNKKIDFWVGNIAKLKYLDKTFDVIVSPWSGLHYLKNKDRVVRELKRVLKDKGILLIEEADETSEYVKILNKIAPKRKLKVKEKRAELKKVLRKYFNVKESKLRTYYYFKNKKQFKGYFEKEIIFDEKKKFTKEMEKKLDEYLSKKRTLKVEEKSIFFVCKKKQSPNPELDSASISCNEFVQNINIFYFFTNNKLT